MRRCRESGVAAFAAVLYRERRVVGDVRAPQSPTLNSDLSSDVNANKWTAELRRGSGRCACSSTGCRRRRDRVIPQNSGARERARPRRQPASGNSGAEERAHPSPSTRYRMPEDEEKLYASQRFGVRPSRRTAFHAVAAAEIERRLALLLATFLPSPCWGDGVHGTATC